MSGEPCRRDGEQWFFFCPRREREARGGRPTRTTPSGYWKATGSPSLVYSSANRVMGVKKTMVFYQGRAPTGTKTEWKMNEYRAVEEGASSISASLASQTRSEPSSYGDSSRRSVRQSGEDDLWLITDDECYSLQDWF
ncbi:hypothetical protein BHM03_00027170 [Ensete ventricosum]|uniref:NAC domain-containing protein n=1 Tax=Ensete ventricosum TaxID=4639 RepID=A0A445MHM4_ENSVE|nr:hypothetical protein BHM03_00027170 [Ensete ventricosum]